METDLRENTENEKEEEERTRRQVNGEDQNEHRNSNEDAPYRISLTAPEELTPQHINIPKRKIPDLNRLQIPKPVRRKNAKKNKNK